MSKARDLANAGTALTAVSATELGYLDGVTSAVQTQINAKQATVSGVNDTEIGYLDGVTSAIQTQIDAQIPKSIVTTKGDILAATGSGTIIRQGIGSNGQVLTADSAEADGLKWAALPSAIPANATATVTTATTTSSTSYDDLPGSAGPAVTVTTGTQALVIVSARMPQAVNSEDGFMSFAVSGATTTAASDVNALLIGSDVEQQNFRASAASSVTLTAGSNTFTAKYRVRSGNPLTFSNRQIFVMNLA
jgi:hypothetical protein